jgi:hypothetical protein
MQISIHEKKTMKTAEKECSLKNPIFDKIFRLIGNV